MYYWQKIPLTHASNECANFGVTKEPRIFLTRGSSSITSSCMRIASCLLVTEAVYFPSPTSCSFRRHQQPEIGIWGLAYSWLDKLPFLCSQQNKIMDYKTLHADQHSIRPDLSSFLSRIRQDVNLISLILQHMDTHGPEVTSLGRHSWSFSPERNDMGDASHHKALQHMHHSQNSYLMATTTWCYKSGSEQAH